VAVFRDKPWLSHDIVIKVVPFLVAPLAISLLSGDRHYWMATIAVNLLGLFVLALACHGEVYRRRPAPALLTEFYLWTSFGGVLGGIFAGLLAPYLFNRTYEYPILVVAALLALPGALNGHVRQFLWRIWPALVVIAAAMMQPLLNVQVNERAALPFQVGLVLLVAWMLLQRRDPARLAALAVCGFVITGVWQPGLNVIETTRSFFGVHRVADLNGGTHRCCITARRSTVRSMSVTPMGRPSPAAGTADLLLFRRADFRSRGSRACGARRIEIRCRRRPRGREPRLPSS